MSISLYQPSTEQQTYVVEYTMTRPRVHNLMSCPVIATPVRHMGLGDLGNPIFCKCLVDLDDNADLAWPLTLVAERPKLTAGLTDPMSIMLSHNGTRPVGYPVFDQKMQMVGVIVSLPPVGETIPTTYWPLVLSQTAWPFCSTTLITADYMPTAVDEAYTLLARNLPTSHVRLEGEVGDTTSARMAVLMVSAWMEAWNAFVLNVVHLLGIDATYLDQADRAAVLRQLCAELKVPEPQGF